jgi:hypothetical protein
MSNIVMTAYLTSTPDPTRGITWDGDHDTVRNSLATLKAGADSFGWEYVVFTDLDIDGPQFVHVDRQPGANPYWRRWREMSKYLDTRSDIQYVMGIDGTDTEMLSDPAPDMEQGYLYVGSETRVIGQEPWLNQKGPMFNNWYSRNADKIVLNAGMLSADVLTFQKFVREWLLFEDLGADNDMPAFQYLLYNEYPDRIVTGHPVHTVFRADARTPGCWWKHK